MIKVDGFNMELKGDLGTTIGPELTILCGYILDVITEQASREDAIEFFKIIQESVLEHHDGLPDEEFEKMVEEAEGKTFEEVRADLMKQFGIES